MERLAKALLGKAGALDEEGKGTEAIATYDEVVRRFGEAAEPALREQVARALDKNRAALSEDGKR